MNVDWYDRGRTTPLGYYGMVRRYNIPFHMTEMHDSTIQPMDTVVTISLSYAEDPLGEELLHKTKYLEKKPLSLREYLKKRDHMLKHHERFSKFNFIMVL